MDIEKFYNGDYTLGEPLAKHLMTQFMQAQADLSIKSLASKSQSGIAIANPNKILNQYGLYMDK